MTDKQPEPEYIITEKHLFKWVLQGKITKGEADVVRSHPHHLAPELTDCPHHCSVFYDGNDKTKPMEHHCDFLTETCEIEENKIRQSERKEVCDKLKQLIDNSKEYGSQDRQELFHYTGLYCMIESLRGVK